jgi:hypothetical protein
MKKKKIALVATPEYSDIMPWLQTYGEVDLIHGQMEDLNPYTWDLLVIPNMYVFSSQEPRVRNPRDLITRIKHSDQIFYYQKLPDFINQNTKILALGSGADLIWHYYGGDLRVTVESPHERIPVLGKLSKSLNFKMQPRKNISIGHDEVWWRTITQIQGFSLEETTDSFMCLTPFLWTSLRAKNTFNERLADNKILFDSLTGHIAGFYSGFSKKIWGLKNLPYKQTISPSSEVYKITNRYVGDLLSHRILEWLLKD